MHPNKLHYNIHVFIKWIILVASDIVQLILNYRDSLIKLLTPNDIFCRMVLISTINELFFKDDLHLISEISIWL